MKYIGAMLISIFLPFSWMIIIGVFLAFNQIFDKGIMSAFNFILFFVVFIIVNLIFVKLIIIIVSTKTEKKERKMKKLIKQRNKLLHKNWKQSQKIDKKAQKAQINEYSNAIIHYLGYVNPANVEYNLRIEKSDECLEVFFKENCVYRCEFTKCTQQKTEGYDIPDVIKRTDDGYEVEKGFRVPRTYHEVETEEILIYSPNEGEWIKLLKKWKKEAKELCYDKEIKELSKEIKKIKK